jgi:hypothetical protein
MAKSVIQSVIDNGKEDWVRISSLLEVFSESIKGSYSPVSLPYLQGERVTQSKFISELEPTGHAIFDKCKYLNKIVYDKFDDDGNPTNYHIEEITRIGIPFQKVIASKAINHITGNPLKWTLANEKGSEEENNIMIELKQYWISKNMEIAFSDLVNSKEKTGDGALYFFRKSNKLDWYTFSFLKGDVLIPIHDSFGQLIKFYRYYSVKAENGKTEEAMMEFDNIYVREYRKRKENSKKDWIMIEEEKHGFSVIPIVYHRGDVSWNDVQILIDQFEWSFSQLCESNEYFAFPILFATGGVDSLPKKGVQGKTLTTDDTEAKAGFLNKGGDMESYKFQLEKLLSFIFMGSFTVNITPDIIKSSGDMPGSAIRIIMHPEVEKAIQLSKEYDKLIDRMQLLFVEGIGLEAEKITKYSSIKFRLEVDIYIPENISEYTTMLNQSVTMGTLSAQTASEKNKYAVNGEYKRIKEEKEKDTSLT